jgi:replicative DNA helicase
MVIGAAIVDNSAMNTLAGMLTSKHFADSRHRILWDAMLSLYQRSQPIDYLTLKAELADNLESVGGVAGIASLGDGMPRSAHPEVWARHVIDKARRRAARKFAADFMEEINNPSIETEDLIERHQENLARLQKARTDGVVAIKDVIPEAMTALDKFAQSEDGLLGIPCGLPDVDRAIGGWQEGALIIIAARPGRGKSVFCAQSAIHAASRGRKVLYVGMEMRPAATAVRMVCNLGGVDRWDLRLKRGFEDRYHNAWADTNRAAGALAQFGIWFDERESPTVAQIKALAKQHQASRGCDLLIVDYLQRCSLPAETDKQWIAVGDIAKNLKSLAQALKIPVIAACQLGTEAETVRPTKRHLAQAAQVIGAEADVIVFLHPPNVEDWQKGKSDTMTLIVDKQRDGWTGDIDLSFERRKVRFVPVGQSDGEWNGAA